MVILIDDGASASRNTSLRTNIVDSTTLTVPGDRRSSRLSRGRSANSARSGIGSSSSTSTVPNSGAGNSVRREAGVEVEKNTGISGLIRARNRNTGWQCLGAGRCDADLDAFHVELGSALTAALVECDDFGTEEVVACCEVWEGDGVFAFVGNEVVYGPSSVGVAFLGEFDPDGALTVGGGGGDVGQNRTFVGLGKYVRYELVNGV